MKRNKKLYLVSILLSFIMFAGAGLVFASGTGTFQAVAAQIGFVVNGQNMEISEQPVIIDNKTYLPVRALGDALGKRIFWDQDSKTVIIDDLLADGVYRAERPDFDEYGYKAMVEITVENGNITAVNYAEVDEQGVCKSQNEAYLAQYNQVTGLDMAAALQALEESLTAAQNVYQVDAVSGATYSSATFKELAAQALAAGPVPAEEK